MTYYNCFGSLQGLLFLNMILENFSKLNLRFYVVPAKIVFYDYIVFI